MEGKDKILLAKIEKWKSKYGGVYQIDVPLDDEDAKATAYFRKPNIQIMSVAQKYIKSDPIKSATTLFDNCWLGGDEEIKDSDEAKLSCCKQLGTIFKIREASLKKL